MKYFSHNILASKIRTLASPVARGVFALAVASQVVPYDQVPVKLNIPTLAELGVSLPQAINNVRQYTTELNSLYPQQNIRYMRTFFDRFVRAPEQAEPKGIDAKLYNALRSTKNQLVDTVNAIRQVKDAGDVSGQFLQDLELIRNAKTVVELVHYFIPQRSQEVTFSLPNNAGKYTITLQPHTSALAVFDRITSLPQMSSSVASTSEAEKDVNRGGLAVELIKKAYTGKAPTPEKRPFASFYAEVYGADINKPLPGEKALKALVEGFNGRVTNPYRIYIADYSPERTGPNSFELKVALADRYVEVDHLYELQFVKAHEQAYDEAASMLHNSHPEISANTFKLFLILNTMEELFWIGPEDPWQDASAAAWYGSEHASAFASTYKKYIENGYAFGVQIEDKIYDLPWRIASFKVPVETQGLGPNAVIPGDLLNAGEFEGGSQWEKYFPGVEQSLDNAVKLALDPKSSVRAVALVYDVKLRELKNHLLSNPAILMPADTYPAILDPGASREYFELTWARYFKAFPEMKAGFPNPGKFPYGHHSWNIEFVGDYYKIISITLGLPDSLPNLKMVLIPSKGLPTADYFGDPKDPKVNDALISIVVPETK